MSQPFKIGLNTKKAGPQKFGPPKRKPVFGGGDDDNSDDDDSAGGVFARGKKSAAAAKKKTAEPVAEAITELGDDFMMGTVAPVADDDDDRRRSKAQRKGAPPSQPPPSKYKGQGHDAQTARNGESAATSTSVFGSDLASAFTARKHVEAAEALDASIYDYDASYDAFKAAGKIKAVKKDGDDDDDDDQDGARKSQYMTSLRKMAEVRERDRRIAEDRKMQREREAEGDDFADKEKFVTEAYKKQQEENRKLEEEERKREAAEAARAAETDGMTGFYKELLVRDEQRQATIQEALDKAKTGTDSGKGDNGAADKDEDENADARARDINARGGNVVVNDDGEVVDKRQLLKSGLNVTARKKTEMEREKERERERERRERERDKERSARDAADARKSQAVFNGGSRQAVRDRQSRMLEEQYAQSLKRARDEEEEKARAAETAAKSRKTTADISSAKERYLARKRAEAEAKKG